MTELTIGGNTYVIRASALIPRIYRREVGRDFMTDLISLTKKIKENKKIKSDPKATAEDKRLAEFSNIDLEMFEDLAYILIKHNNPDIPNTIEEWLDSIDGVFSIYTVLPQILEEWKKSTETTSTARKK